MYTPNGTVQYSVQRGRSLTTFTRWGRYLDGPKTSIFVNFHTIENVKARGVGGQKSQNFVNVVCERPQRREGRKKHLLSIDSLLSTKYIFFWKSISQTNLDHYSVTSEPRGRFFSKFVAFSQYLNFTCQKMKLVHTYWASVRLYLCLNTFFCRHFTPFSM